MTYNSIQRFSTNPNLPTALPGYQKKIVEAIRNGSYIWMDNYGKKTYHIKLNKATHTIPEPHIATLIFRGFLDQETLVLTDFGAKVKLL